MIMKKRFLAVSAIALLLAASTVTAHKAAVEEDENAAPKIEDPTLNLNEEPYIQNIQKP